MKSCAELFLVNTSAYCIWNKINISFVITVASWRRHSSSSRWRNLNYRSSGPQRNWGKGFKLQFFITSALIMWGLTAQQLEC